MRTRTSLGNAAGAAGRRAIEAADHTMNLAAFTVRLFALLARRPRRGRVLARRMIVEQVYYTGVQALPILVSVSLLMGALVSIQLSKLSTHYDFGKMLVVFMVREAGPMLTALVVLLRSGVAMVVELSYMRILNEVEALEMSGIDPMRTLCLPRMLGTVYAMVCLFIVFEMGAVVGGNFLAWFLTEAATVRFYEKAGQAITLADAGVGFFKVAAFGVIICVVSTYRGLTVPRSMTAIPAAASRAAIESLMFILVANVAVTAIMYV